MAFLSFRVSFLQLASPRSTYDVIIQTNASGFWGCGAFLCGQWFQWCWPSDWASENIMVKELVPIVLSCAVWGPQLAKKKVLFQCDNTGVVAAIKKGSAQVELAMHLLRCLWFFAARFDILVDATHIAGVLNCTADQLSRNLLDKFFHSRLSYIRPHYPQSCWSWCLRKVWIGRLRPSEVCLPVL